MVPMSKEQWRTLMTQQAEPSQVPTGHVYLPEITPEMWETLGDTDVMTWIDGPQWTQIAVDFASMLPVKMPAQHHDKDRLRFQSACEISGEKHAEYVRGYEAAMDAVCKTQPEQAQYSDFPTPDAGFGGQPLIWEDDPEPQPAPIPTGWQPIETAPDGLHLRAAWVYNVPNHDWMIEVHSGYVDDYGMFVNQYGDTYGIAPNGYFGWQPQPPAPGGEG